MNNSGITEINGQKITAWDDYHDQLTKVWFSHGETDVTKLEINKEIIPHIDEAK